MNDRSYLSLRHRERKRREQKTAILLIETNIPKVINRYDVHFESTYFIPDEQELNILSLR